MLRPWFLQCAYWSVFAVLVAACVDQPIVALERRNSGGAGGRSNSGSMTSSPGGSWVQGGSYNFGGFNAGGTGQFFGCLLKGATCDLKGKSSCCGELYCYANKCIDPQCSSSDESCSEDIDCCMSLNCKKETGKCDRFFCGERGEACVDHKNCCSKLCDYSPGSDNKTCQVLSGCSPIGERCTSDWECCTADCKLGRCSSQDRCGRSGEVGCDAPGVNCCGPLKCENDTLDVPRCVESPCVELGKTCSHDSSCCPNSNGNVACLWNERSPYRTCTLISSNATGGTGGMGNGPQCGSENADCSISGCCAGNGLTCNPISLTCTRQ
jgi:hypothetical protein